MNLRRGDRIVVKDSSGKLLPKRAFGPITNDGWFPVVWACREEEWQAAIAEDREPEGMPWPARDVQIDEQP